MSQSPKPEPSAAFRRFKKSMVIDYNKWHDGEPYDIPALAEITPEERDQLVDEIIANASLDWRDVEALRALGTPKAIARVGMAAKRQHDGAGAEALEAEIERNGWSSETEQRLIVMLQRMKSMSGAADRLYWICEEHPTPAVMAQLLRNARDAEPVLRYSAGAFLLYLTGHSDDWYGFGEYRPRLLDLNTNDYQTWKATVAWLEEMVAHPRKKGP